MHQSDAAPRLVPGPCTRALKSMVSFTVSSARCESTCQAHPGQRQAHSQKLLVDGMLRTGRHVIHGIATVKLCQHPG